MVDPNRQKQCTKKENNKAIPIASFVDPQDSFIISKAGMFKFLDLN
jgi:hypothetical protein